MALDTVKLAKVVALIDSSVEAEGVSAFRMAKKLLGGEGLEMSKIIEAGLASLTSAAPRRDTLLGDFDDMIGAFGRAAAAAKSKATQPRPKAHIIVEPNDLPDGFFNATVKISDRRKTRTKEPMLILEVTHDNVEAFKHYGAMYAFGDVVRQIEAACSLGDETVSCAIRIKRPQQFGHLPIVTSVQF